MSVVEALDTMRLHRIVEYQAKTVTRHTTDTQQEYEYIEGLVEGIKTPLPATGHDYLIATPFRYPLPVAASYQARFKPPLSSKHAFYGTEQFRTCGYETAYHWLRQRVHLKELSQTAEPRTHFQVKFHDSHLMDIRHDPGIDVLMNRHDYGASHRFVEGHPAISSMLYPSCRDPDRRPCVVTFRIETLGKKPEDLHALYFIYDRPHQACRIEDPTRSGERFSVAWEEVS